MNTYKVPTNGMTHAEYTNYCFNLPWEFNNDRCIYPDPYLEEVSVNGTIVGFEQVIKVLNVDRAVIKAAIKDKRDKVKFGGVYVSGKWFHTDTDSRSQWLGLNMMGANIPAALWTTMDGTEITLTQSLAGAVFLATATLDMTAFAVAKSHIAAMEISDNPDAYDFSAGWPVTYIG